MSRRNLGLDPRRVDQLSAEADIMNLAREHGAKTSVAQVVAHRKVAHAAGGQKALVHQRRIVAADFGAGWKLAVALVEAHLVDPIASKRTRADAIEGRRLVQADERIGVVPVSTGR